MTHSQSMIGELMLLYMIKQASLPLLYSHLNSKLEYPHLYLLVSQEVPRKREAPIPIE